MRTKYGESFPSCQGIAKTTHIRNENAFGDGSKGEEPDRLRDDVDEGYLSGTGEPRLPDPPDEAWAGYDRAFGGSKANGWMGPS